MELKFGIDPLYQAWLFDTFGNCSNLHICSNTSLFDMHWAMILIKMHCIKSLNIKMKVFCNYSVDWTHQTLLGRADQKLTWVLEKTSFSFYLWYCLPLQNLIWCIFWGKYFHLDSTLENVFQGCGCKCFKKSEISRIIVTGLSLTWNFDVLEMCIYSRVQWFLQGTPTSPPHPPATGWGILGSGNLTRSDFDHLNAQS